MPANADGGRTKRPWLAAVLSLIMPGFGQFYLREWVRGLLWIGLAYTTTFLLVPQGARDVALSLDGVQNMWAAVPLEVKVSIVAVTLLSVADAYWLAVTARREATASPTTSCPNCGKELDEDIDFCHWCTTRLDEPLAEDERSV